MIANTDNNSTIFINDFEKVFKKSQTPSWIADFRQKSLSRFNSLGFPTVKDEEWKYTNIAPITRLRFDLTTDEDHVKLDPIKGYLSSNEIRLTFLNGAFAPQLSDTKNLPKGLEILPINDALKKHEPKIKELLSINDPKDESVFAALNKTIFTDGAYIAVEKKAVIKDVIHILHLTTSRKSLLSSPYSVITIGEAAQATILESHLSSDDNIVYFANPLTEIFMAENSNLNYTKAQKESLKAYHIGHTRIHLKRNANLNSFSLSAGSLLTRNNLDVKLEDEGTSAMLNGLYSLYGHQLVDNHSCVDHQQPNCTSNQLYKGILNESSHAVFNGKILVKPIAQKTNSYQLNKHLLLGKDARVDTKPQLEIEADDVKCTHGATIGQLNPDELFYLQTRCIGRHDATQMLAHGFVDDILKRIDNEEIQRRLNYLLVASFAHLK